MSNVRIALLAAIAEDPSVVEKGRISANGIKSEVLKSLDPSLGRPLKKTESLKTLLKFAERLEERLKNLIARNSVQWWLAIARKLPLELFLPRMEMFSSATQVRWTFDRAIIKFGGATASDIARLKDGSSAPMVDGSTDLERFFCALFVALDVYGVATCYRRVAKGASFSTSLGVCEAPPEANRLMRLFDERKERNGDLLDVFGSPYRVDSATSGAGPLGEPFIFLATPNATDYESAMRVSTTFAEGYLSLARVQEAASLWDELGIRVRGFTPSALIALLSALCWSRWAPGTDHETAARDVMFDDLRTNGYSAVLEGAVESDLNYYVANIGAFLTPAVQKVPLPDEVVHRFVSKFSSRRSIDIHYGVNSPLIVRQGPIDLIDWLAAASFIRDWIGELTLSQRIKIGTIRGIVFEEKMRSYLKRQLNSRVVLWPPRTRPRSGRERTKSRDVDLAVIRGDVMVLVECKVKIGVEGPMSRASTLERKEQWEVSLWKRALEWLRQVDETADALAAGHPTTDGYTIPRTIRFIVPLVCSPIVAYIPRDNPQYFLTPKIPRVCTPKELVELLTADLSQAVSCRAVRKVPSVA